jgi:hypothetical protein
MFLTISGIPVAVGLAEKLTMTGNISMLLLVWGFTCPESDKFIQLSGKRFAAFRLRI